MAKTKYDEYLEQLGTGFVNIESIKDQLNSLQNKRSNTLKLLEEGIDSDDTVLNDYEKALRSLDRREKDLLRRLELAQQAENRPTKKTIKIAQEAYDELRDDMAQIIKRWDAIKSRLIKKRRRFLKLVAECGQLREDERELRSKINHVVESLDPSVKQKWIPGPKDAEVDLRLMRGWIFIPPMETREAYLKGVVPDTD
jgi:chromosome segregation ATPase